MFVDSHCHLDRLDLSPYNNDLQGAISAAVQNGVTRMLCVGIDLGNAQTMIDIAREYKNVYASVGIHPMDVENQFKGLTIDTTEEDNRSWSQLRQLAKSDDVIAIGETGLDYFYSEKSALLQQNSFRKHLEIAASIGKPVIVHTRNAQKDTIQQISNYGDIERGGVLHCFTEGWEMARKAIDLNYYISFSGIVTFKNAQELREVAKKVPIERLLIETDSPYLAPVPYRSKKNEPKYVVEVARCLAEVHGIAVEEIAEITSTNFDNLFHT